MARRSYGVTEADFKLHDASSARASLVDTGITASSPTTTTAPRLPTTRPLFSSVPRLTAGGGHHRRRFLHLSPLPQGRLERRDLGPSNLRSGSVDVGEPPIHTTSEGSVRAESRPPSPSCESSCGPGAVVVPLRVASSSLLFVGPRLG
eukprot:6057319-Pyramimonas_sp.AAC.1